MISSISFKRLRGKAMSPNSNSGGYTYQNAGFNGFLRRTIASDPNMMTLNQMKRSTVGNNSINFDQMQVSGNLGDTVEVGKLLLNGASGDGYLAGRDDTQTQVWRTGDLEAE